MDIQVAPLGLRNEAPAIGAPTTGSVLSRDAVPGQPESTLKAQVTHRDNLRITRPCSARHIRPLRGLNASVRHGRLARVSVSGVFGLMRTQPMGHKLARSRPGMTDVQNASGCTARSTSDLEARGLLPADSGLEGVSRRPVDSRFRDRVCIVRPCDPVSSIGYSVRRGRRPGPLRDIVLSSHPATTTAPITPATNTGLCKLVSPSVVATALSQSMTFPETLAHASRQSASIVRKKGPARPSSSGTTPTRTVPLLPNRRDTSNAEARSWGRSQALGDQAFYFSEQSGQVSVTTVVLSKGHLQMLITGSATLESNRFDCSLRIEPVRGQALASFVVELSHRVLDHETTPFRRTDAFTDGAGCTTARPKPARLR